MSNENMRHSALVYNGAVIRDRGDRLNLTDMWRAAGSDPSRTPAEWQRSLEAQRFIEFVSESNNMGVAHVIRTTRGRNGCTEAHWQVGLAYAKAISPEFHAWCNTVVREKMQGGGRQELSPAIVGGVFKGVLEKRIEPIETAVLTLAEQVRGLIIGADPRVAVDAYVSALKVCQERNVPQKGRRGFVLKVSSQLRAYCGEKGMPVRRGHFGGQWVFPPEAVEGWLSGGGAAMIADYKAMKMGQTVIDFRKGRSA